MQLSINVANMTIKKTGVPWMTKPSGYAHNKEKGGV